MATMELRRRSRQSTPPGGHRGRTFHVGALVVGLGVVFLPGSAPGQVSRDYPPNLTEAERELREGRRALEEIVGSELLRAEPPALPDVPELGLSESQSTLLRRLAEARPESWTPEDRAGIEELAPVALELRSGLSADGEVVAVEDLATVGPDLLRAARTLAVFDRLALLDGDEAAFVDGLELRLDLAAGLQLQRGAVGALLGAAILRPVLEDVQRAARRPETLAASLARLEALLLRWRDRVPDAAAVLAREGLLSLDMAEDQPGALGVPDPAGPLLMAPVAHGFALLAEGCREEGCRNTVEGYREGWEAAGDPYRVIADMLIPNLLDMVRKVEALTALTDLAAAALALRLEAAESGRYPASPRELSGVPAARREAGALGYETTAEGGVRLGLTPDAILSAWPQGRRDELRGLLSWELPPVAR